MNKFHLLLLLLAAITLSCNQKGNINEKKDRLCHYQLQPKENICFPLDSVTSQLFSASEYNAQMDVYSFLHRNTLLIYDYSTQKLKKKIPIQANYPSSYSIINKDTILVADYNTSSFLLMNDSGSIYKTLKVNHTIEFYPFPITKTAPIRLENDTIIFWGNISGEYIDENEHNRNVMGFLDLNTLKTSYKVSYPSIYENNNLGGGLYRWVYACYNPKEKKYIVSFPADHYIYNISNTDTTSTHYAGSQDIDQINYMKYSKLLPIDSNRKSNTLQKIIAMQIYYMIPIAMYIIELPSLKQNMKEKWDGEKIYPFSF